jgi:osmoprotectant transport system permease protein
LILQEFGLGWGKMLTQPEADNFAAEGKKASLSRLILAVALTCLLGTLILTQPSKTGLPLWIAAARWASLVLISFLAVVLALFLVARLLGGKGGALHHFYVMAELAVPGVLVLGLLGRLDIRAALLDLTSLLGLSVITLLLLLIYGFLLLLLALDGVHRFGGRQAFQTAAIVILVGVALRLIYAALSGTESLLLRYILYFVERWPDVLSLSLAHAQIVLFSTSIATVLGVIAGVLITLPPHAFRGWHLVFLPLLAAFALLWFGPRGSLGAEVADWFSEAGPIGRFIARPEAVGLVGMILFLVYYGLYLAGERAADPALYTAGILLTVPSIALFGIFIPIFGIGFFNAAVALILYAQLPILRNTYTGIKAVRPSVIESARGMGMTEWQILYQIKMPLAMPVIMAGIRVSIVMIVGIAAIATLIGVEVLGDLIFAGMQRISDRLVFTGALAVSIFAILLDIVLGWAERFLTPAGLQGREREAA